MGRAPARMGLSISVQIPILGFSPPSSGATFAMTALFTHPGPGGRFSLGFLLALILSGLLMRWLAPAGWMDTPAGRRQHDRPTPKTGGLALSGVALLGLASGLMRLPLTGAEWSIVFFMAATGALDDRFDIRARWKALAGLGAGLALALLSWGVLKGGGSHLPLLGGHLATHTGLALVLLWAWYWSIPQACNLIDGLDGLALGFFLLLAASLDFPRGPEAHGALLLGALGALLVLNWPSGAQFLGDSGSLMLGTLFAILGVKWLGRVNPNHLLCAFAYPIVDVLMVMAIRTLRGSPLGEGDRNHFHHQWLRRSGHGWAALLLTLAPAAACMQILGDYRGHQYFAWAGLLWLTASAAFFIHRSLASQPADAACGMPAGPGLLEPLEPPDPAA